jgi:hypothetical protein
MEDEVLDRAEWGSSRNPHTGADMVAHCVHERLDAGDLGI